MTAPPAPSIPQRHSLVDQVVAILRSGISGSRWHGELPSEAALCRELQVSRVTLRKALAQLIHERWLTAGGRGHHHRIRRKAPAPPVVSGRVLRVLSPYSLPVSGAVLHSAMETFAEHVARSGYRVEFEHRPQLFQRHQPAGLRRLADLPDTAGWLLFYSTEPMQRWFAASGTPCVVAGDLHEGVNLPCVYWDTRAAARHAVGRFLANGHRDLVYLIAEHTSLADRRASVVFAEEAVRLGARARIVSHSGDMQSVRAALDHLVPMRPRPTGYFTASSECSLTALCYFLGHGLRIPDTVAIIAGWSDEYMDQTVPTIARYRVDGMKLGRKLGRLFVETLTNGAGKGRSIRILPDFVKGGTLGQSATPKLGAT